MSVILRSDMFLKDQASVARFRDILDARLPKIEASGGSLMQAYVNEDDPQHLMFLERWESREHFHAYMAWAMEQQGRGEIGSLLAQPPQHVWLTETDG